MSSYRRAATDEVLGRFRDVYYQIESLAKDVRGAFEDVDLVSIALAGAAVYLAFVCARWWARERVLARAVETARAWLGPDRPDPG